MTATVLVADDSLVVRTILCEQLAAQGFAVLEATNGDDALAVCRRELPDIVLLDIDMPRRDGHQVLAQMRDADETRHIPVVFLSGRVRVADAVEGLRLGAHDYLRKPVEASELVARVHAALRVKRLEDELRRRNRELVEASRTDALTGLFNRRHLGELMVSLAHRPDSSSDTAIVIVDIDHFKRVNDTYGHAAGDATLREVASMVRAVAGTGAVVGRWGGEEFLIIAPSMALSDARSLAERIRLAVAAAALPTSDGRSLTVTVSAGCAAGAGDLDNVVRLADVALYEAKNAGRNTVRVRE